MDLHVTFKGLCLFVPDPNGKLMHVLLPASGGTGHGGHDHAHDAKLDYKGTKVSLHGRVLDLTTAGGTGDKIEVGPNAFPVGKLIGKQIDSEQWKPCPRPSVAARITLPRAGTIELAKPMKFRVEKAPNPFFLTNKVTWIVPGVKIDPRTWVLAPLCPDSGHTPIPLPALNGNEVKVCIEHLPRRPGKDPKKDDPAEHVEIYYTLFKEPAKGPIPILDEHPLNTKSAPLGATPFNCMVGVAPGEP